MTSFIHSLNLANKWREIDGQDEKLGSETFTRWLVRFVCAPWPIISWVVSNFHF